MDNAEKIFNKYAVEYLQKYKNVDLYSESLDFLLKNLKPQSKILELACGPGNITKYLLSKRPDLNILGVDFAQSMIELARTHNPEARFKVMDVREIYRLDQKYDAIVGGFCLPYLNKDESYSFIRHSSLLLNKGGILYLSLMEDDYDNSGYIGSSKDPEEKLFTYYHEKEYLLDYLQEYDFELLFSDRIVNDNNKENVKDLILICNTRNTL